MLREGDEAYAKHVQCGIQEWGGCTKLPLDRAGMVIEEVLIGLGEMTAAVESPIDGQGTGMRGGEHEVLPTIDKRTFALRITAPKHEDEVRALLTQGSDGGIGEFFPTFVLMASCPMCFHG